MKVFTPLCSNSTFTTVGGGASRPERQAYPRVCCRTHVTGTIVVILVDMAPCPPLWQLLAVEVAPLMTDVRAVMG